MQDSNSLTSRTMTTLRVTVISFRLIHYKAEPKDNEQQDYATSATIPLSNNYERRSGRDRHDGINARGGK
jgi:hypothetical protein